MATLNLSGYEITKGSIIGYSTDKGFDVVGGDSISSAPELFSQYTQVGNTGNTWSVNLTAFDSVLSGFEDVSGKNWAITVNGANTTEFELGSGADSVVLTKSNDDTEIKTGDGKDAVTVEAAAAGGLVDLGDGADIVVVEDGAKISITGGAGKDSVDVSDLASGTVTLTDFDATEDKLVTGSGVDTNSLGSDGTVKLVKGGTVKVNATNGSYTLTTEDGEIAWSASASGETSVVDMSSSTKAVTIYGNNDATAEDTLLGGTKNDTIHVGAGNYAYGGKGKDSIVMNSATGTQESVGLTAEGGKDKVTNFEEVASGVDGDVIRLTENAISDGFSLKQTSSGLVAKQGSASLTIENLSTSKAETVINVEDASGTNYVVDYVNGTAGVSDVDDIHDVYYADASNKNVALNFSTVDDSLVVDLGNTGLQSNTGNAIYYGDFASVTGGSDTTVLMGAADNKETLIAGTGATTLWGGSGKTADVLVGNSDTDNAVTFFYTADNGKDTVKSARWGSDETDDVLYLSGVSISKIKNSGSSTTFTASTGNTLTVEGIKADTAVKWTTDGEDIQLAKIGTDNKSNTWTYEEGVSMYLGGKNNSLKVSSGDANVWLAGTEGTTYSNVTKVDASSADGTVVIAGDGAVSETIIGGKGDNSLWGGAGSSNDTLKGSTTGTSTYYFGQGDGNDVITNSSSDDKVLLYNVTLNDIADINNSTANQLKFTLNDGSTLTVTGMTGNSVTQYQLSDGSTWTYDVSSKSWSQN